MWCVPAFLPSWWLCLGFHPEIRTCQANCAPPQVLGPFYGFTCTWSFRGVFWRYYQSYLDEISCFFLLYFVKFYFPFSLKNLWWIQSVFYILNLWWIQSVFYILNLWWIQSVFISSSYLSPSFIIIAFFLSSSLSFFLSTSLVGSGTSHLLMTRHLLCLFPP